jgi:hypothetical protein
MLTRVAEAQGMKRETNLPSHVDRVHNHEDRDSTRSNYASGAPRRRMRF